MVVASISNAAGVARGSSLGGVGLFKEVCTTRTTAFRECTGVWGDFNRGTVVHCCRVDGKGAGQ